MTKVMINSLPPELVPEEIAELEAAEKMPIVFDDDCPEMLKHFHKMNTVAIGISVE